MTKMEKVCTLGVGLAALTMLYLGVRILVQSAMGV